MNPQNPSQNPDRQYDPQPPVPPHLQNQQPQTVRYIAVDENGVPLPNQPANIVPAQQGGNPQSVYMSRPIEPPALQLTAEEQQRHEDSTKKYSSLNLSEGEYVISAIKRHPIGLVSIWFVVGIVMVVLIALLAIFAAYRNSLQVTGLSELPPIQAVGLLVAILAAMAMLGGIIATIVYNGNRFYLTNESVIQEIQTSLFTRREQTVSLGNIEDASYHQDGILQALIGYGSIRLSTEGDETTYRFNYVSQPKTQIAILNNAVEAFKNGRPVTGHH